MLDVLILAAGRGRRLRPLTDAIPKPLLPLGGKSVLEHHLDRLKTQGFRRVVINLSWLGQQIRQQVGDGRRFGLRIRYSDEGARALETGGGITQALALLASDPFIVINGDIFTDFNYAALTVPPPYAMHLVLAPNPPHHPHGDFGLTAEPAAAEISSGESHADGEPHADGKAPSEVEAPIAAPILGDSRPGGESHARLIPATAGRPCWTYSGIGCFRRQVFENLDIGRFPLRPVLDHAIAHGLASAEIHHGRWLDIGALPQLEAAQQLAGDSSDHASDNSSDDASDDAPDDAPDNSSSDASGD